MLDSFRNLKERLCPGGTVKGYVEPKSWDAVTRALFLPTALNSWFILEITVQPFCNYLCLIISIVLMENLICG